MNSSFAKKLEPAQVISQIKAVAKEVLPHGSTVYLYGSRARGDNHEDSDWDLLVLLDKDEASTQEREDYSYAFEERGWDIGEDINARVYTKKRWYNSPRSLFYFNVEEDKKIIYGT